MEKAFSIRWKVVGFAGGGAFVLSFLLGILSGNPFFTILFRALLFGGLFAFLGGGAAFLLDRFVPQLTGADTASPEEARNVRRESNVDIVLDGESTLKDEPIEELSLEDADEAANRAGEGGSGRTSSRVSNFSGAEGETRNSLEDAVEIPETVEAEFAADLVSPEGEAASDSDTMEEVTEETPPPAAKAGKQTTAGTGPALSGREKDLEEGDLDVLPDMSSFESSFSPVTDGGIVTDTDSFESFGTDSLKKGDLDKDPETYVKAVRTVLKRDEGKKQ